MPRSWIPRAGRARAAGAVPALALAVGMLGAPVLPLPARQPTSTPELSARACVSRLPLDVRIGQTMLVITDDPAAAGARLREGLVAGMLSTGILSTSKARAFRTATRGARYGAILGADEEGGLVQRYRRVIGSIPSAATQARTMSPAQVRALYAAHGAKLRRWGVNVVFAPDSDVGSGPGIGTRSYSADPRVVARYAAAAAAGYRDAGLLPVAKHFPGHGRTTADTHSSASIGPGLKTLRAVDLVPFATLVHASRHVAVMVGHTQVPGYSDMPSSQSRAVITGLLRRDLGFDGLVISDALGMTASGTHDQGAAMVGFLRAGGDLGIVGLAGSIAARRDVRAALHSGQLTASRLDAAAARVLAAKGVDPCRLAGAPAPAQDGDAPATSDAPIVNPTEDPAGG